MLVNAAANANARPVQAREEMALIALHASLQAHQRMVEQGASSIAHIASVLIHALQNGKKILFCGNGGSAADAQHAAAELVGRFYRERSALPALSLSTDTSVLTAVGNDWAFDEVFARQVQALGAPGDVLIGLSTSGRSKNIVRAFEEARCKRMVAIALTGQEGREVAQASDLSFCVPTASTPRVQELHILALHSICEIVESALFFDPELADAPSAKPAHST